MIKLQIRKKTTKVWQHFITDGENFILSKCYCKTNGNKFRVVEDGGTAKKEYLYSEIEVYDDLSGGSAETFTSSLQLMNRLSALNYVGFSKDGDVVIADLISSDSSNALIEGADGKLYVPSADTSSFATTTQLNEGLATKAPTNHTHTIAQVDNLQTELNGRLSKNTTPLRLYATNDLGEQVMKPISELEAGTEILVDLNELPSTNLIETIVGTYDLSKMVNQDGIIEVNLRHGKQANGTQQIFIYFSDSALTFGQKVASNQMLSTQSSVGFTRMFYIKNNVASSNRTFNTFTPDDWVLGNNSIKTTVVNNINTKPFMHIVLLSNVASNTIYGFIKNVK